jgi:hypothetical protein
MPSKAKKHLPRTKTLSDYLALRVKISEKDCWEWTKYKDRDGYGRHTDQWYKMHGKCGAHQLSYIAHIGPIAPGLLVCHTCDNPSCINPAHLFLGTPQDNMDDKKNKGRQHVMSATQRKTLKDIASAPGGLRGYYGLDNKGSNNPNYGNTHPGLNAGKDNAMYGLKGKNNPNFGSTRTAEQKQNISMGIIKDNMAIYEQILTRLQSSYKVTQTALAKEFGVSIATISRLKNGIHAISKLKENNHAK